MPLDGYGVLVGTLASHNRDEPDSQGRWYHVNLRVEAPAGQYRCAIDVDSKQSTTGVEWMHLVAAASAFAPATGLPPGYHPLASLPTSGALDLIRHPAFRPGPGCWFVRQPPPWLTRWIELLRRPRWTSGSHLEASTALESILVVGARIWIFGEPFTSGLGMHNVHQNQGDPAGSQWWAENGIWQDGGTLVERADSRFDVFVSKFSTQSYKTDDQGHPI